MAEPTTEDPKTKDFDPFIQNLVGSFDRVLDPEKIADPDDILDQQTATTPELEKIVWQEAQKYEASFGK